MINISIQISIDDGVSVKQCSTNDLIEVDTDIPGNREFGLVSAPYPWRQLAVGDCFLVDKPKKTFSAQVYDAQNRTGYHFLCTETEDRMTWVERVK
jgi:hypothetical protein